MEYGDCIKIAKKFGVTPTYVSIINGRRKRNHHFYSPTSKKIAKALAKLDMGKR